MATYVNNLRLKEIATGAESGTWGTSTNTNLELIGDGLGYGTEQVAADSNETFTMADGAADGMRAMYLKFTSAGSLTATRELTLALFIAPILVMGKQGQVLWYLAQVLPS